MVGIMQWLRRSDANSRYNVRHATGVPDHRAANSEKEATLTKKANEEVNNLTGSDGMSTRKRGHYCTRQKYELKQGDLPSITETLKRSGPYQG